MLFNLIERKMEEIVNTDLTMVASRTFSDVINLIQSSCLNFHIQMSPFSAIISLKKKLVNDRDGNPKIPTSRLDCFSGNDSQIIAQNKKLRADLDTLKKEHEQACAECIIAYDTIRKLQNELEMHDDMVNTPDWSSDKPLNKI